MGHTALRREHEHGELLLVMQDMQMLMLCTALLGPLWLCIVRALRHSLGQRAWPRGSCIRSCVHAKERIQGIRMVTGRFVKPISQREQDLWDHDERERVSIQMETWELGEHDP